ncbi:MAG: PqqD family protein [Oscillospiraceae bacterium]|nr:PqqD family protein [Oscillospiraceae bacterium]
MKLRKEFITHVVNGEQFMVATGKSDFSGIVRSNSTAAFIVDCLKSSTDTERIAGAMMEKYEVDRDTARKDAEAVIRKLRSIGAIED